MFLPDMGLADIIFQLLHHYIFTLQNVDCAVLDLLCSQTGCRVVESHFVRSVLQSGHVCYIYCNGLVIFDVFMRLLVNLRLDGYIVKRIFSLI